MQEVKDKAKRILRASNFSGLVRRRMYKVFLQDLKDHPNFPEEMLNFFVRSVVFTTIIATK